MIKDMKSWIDVTVPLRDAMVHWPGDPPVNIKRIRDLEKGDGNTISQMSLATHAGTHMDAPAHFIRKGTTIDKMPIDATVGRTRVIEIFDKESIKIEELADHKIRRGERIIFKTRNSTRAWKTDRFIEDFVYISLKAADFLVKRGVKTIGVDYLSVGGFKRDGSDVHRKLLGAGIWVIEGLDLSKVQPGRYELICLPLKIDRADGAPARVVLREV